MVYVARIALIALYTVFWGTLACLVAPFPRSVVAIMWIGKTWLGWILATCRIRVDTSGLEHVDPERPVVFMSNHQSLFDIAALVVTLPPIWRFVAKRELTFVPFFGWALAMCDQIIIDRSNRARSVESLKRAAGKIREGRSVIIFPEGTRSTDGRIQPFKSGGFHMAIEAQVPIQPVTVSGSQRLLRKRSLKVESGLIKIHFGEPIPTAGLTVDDRQALKDRVRAAIEAGFDPAYQRDHGHVPASAHAGPQGILG